VIEDNGVGFDVARWQQGRLGRDGCGLRMIRHWVEASGGHCSIESTPRHGSRVQALWRLESVPRGIGSAGSATSRRDRRFVRFAGLASAPPDSGSDTVPGVGHRPARLDSAVRGGYRNPRK